MPSKFVFLSPDKGGKRQFAFSCFLLQMTVEIWIVIKVRIVQAENISHVIIKAAVVIVGCSTYYVVNSSVLPILNLSSSSDSFKMLLGRGDDVMMESTMECVIPDIIVDDEKKNSLSGIFIAAVNVWRET